MEPWVGIPILVVAGFLAYIVRGITGGASAVVFNALFGLGLAFGLTGGMDLLDGLYWVALADWVTALVLLVTLRSAIRPEPFLVRYLVVSLPISVAATVLLPGLDVDALTIGLGASLAAAGLYLLLRGELATWDEATLVRRAVPAGVVTGILGGLYGMGGPVTVVFLAHAGGDPGRFRARVTLLSVFWGTARVGTLLLTGALAPEMLVRFGLTLPVVLGGLALGFSLHPRVSPAVFRAILGTTVTVAGSALILRTLVG